MAIEQRERCIGTDATQVGGGSRIDIFVDEPGTGADPRVLPSREILRQIAYRFA